MIYLYCNILLTVLEDDISLHISGKFQPSPPHRGTLSFTHGSDKFSAKIHVLFYQRWLGSFICE